MIPASPARIAQIARFVGLVFLAMLALAGTAWSHASLNATEPADGAIVEMAPESYSLTFSEPVSPLSLLLVRPDGMSIPLERFAVKDSTVEIEAPGELSPGTYALSWRIVSEDGHPVGGSLVFSIGAASAKGPQVAEDIDWPVRSWLWAGKVALYVGLFFGIGGVFALRILIPEANAGNRIVAVMLVTGAVGAVSSLGFQGLDAIGAPIDRFTEPVIWSTAFETSFGSTVVAALIAFALAGGALCLQGVISQVIAVAALLLAGIALSLSGHASAASPQWLMRPTVFLHATAVAIWIGALVPLGLAMHRNLPGAAQALRRFSHTIPAIVAVLILAGIVLAVVQVAQPAALFDTAYGRVFLIKLALLVGLFLLAAVNRWFLTMPAKAGDPFAARRLVRAIAVETLITLLIFGAVAAWRFTPPPRALAVAASAPVSVHIHSAKAVAELTITPGRTGATDVSATIATSDLTPLDAKEVAFVFSNPDAGIEPFRRKAERSGDGIWRANGIILPQPGEWSVRVDVLINDFEIAKLTGQLTIRS